MVRMNKVATIGNRALSVPTRRGNRVTAVVALVVVAALCSSLAPLGLATVHNQELSGPAVVVPGDPSVIDVVIKVNDGKTTVTITGRVTDDGAVGGLEVVFTGAVDGVTETDAEGAFSMQFDYPSVTPADVEITAEDADGNISEVVVRTIN